MSSLQKIIGLLLGLVLLPWTVEAQLDVAMKRAGFEQVHILEQSGSYLIQYEHRNFRDPLASMDLIRTLAAEDGIADSLLRLAPLLWGENMGVFDADNRWTSLEESERHILRQAWSPQKYRFNFRLMPDLNIRFGNFEQPIQEKFGMLLDTRVYVLPGLSVHTGLYVPITNRLDRTSERPHIGPSHVNYLRQIKPGHFVMLQTGLFVFDRYGWDVQYRYAPYQSRWSYGLQVNRTGFYVFSQERFFTGPVSDWVALADVEYRLPWEGLTIKAMGGQFLAGDRGVRMDLIRQYGSWDVGFFATATEFGNSAGFQLAFPLWPGKLLRSRRLELRTTEEFRWEYSINAEAPVGRRYRTGTPRLDDLLRQYGRN
ncbi:YjbH domain-containing protein [Mongoliitalea daihaiensis]|uniref:YjbH domain-containing protein n=1 Tax=Mongoliitalea daihaiensis TaxID=2782006 RepID=UPI001F477BEB|nr:YjbH domain-containing protein [Mongoliitalea daihaiensis]UJP64446.1 YjbH domain-containing protein [Mongoliitalea daihaiensis]